MSFFLLQFDSKTNPLAMLTQACNKIESDMMNGSSAFKKTSENGHQHNNNNNNNLNRTSSPSSSLHHGGGKMRPKSRAASTASSGSFSPPMATSTSPGAISHQPHKQTSPKSSSPTQRTHPAMPSAAAVSLAASYGINPFYLTPPLTSSAPPPPASAYPTPSVDSLYRDQAARAAQIQASYAALTARMAASAANPFLSPYMMYPGLFPPAPPPTTTTTSVAPSSLPSPPKPVTSTTTTTAPPSTPSPSLKVGSSPYVCNWMQGKDGFCGRRFSTSEDLMSHLRSHTTVASAAVTSSSSPKQKEAQPSQSPQSSKPEELAALQLAQQHAAALYGSSQQQQQQPPHPALARPSSISPVGPSPATSALAMLQAHASKIAAAQQQHHHHAAAAASFMDRYHPYARPGASALPPAPAGIPGLPFPPHHPASLLYPH